MDTVDRQIWNTLASHEGEPSVTATLPVTRDMLATDEYSLRVRSLHAEADAGLAERGVAEADRRRVLEPLRALQEARPGVPRRGMTLVAALAPSQATCLRHEGRLPERVAVADHFVLTDALVRLLDTPPKWLVVGVWDDGARLVEVTDGVARERTLPLERESRADANRERVSPTPGGDAHTHAAPGSGASAPHRFGEEDVDRNERATWYRFIDEGLTRSGVGAHPLVLVAQSPHHAGFSRTCTHPGLAEEAIDRNPAELSTAELAEVARPLAEHWARPDLEALRGAWSRAEEAGRGLVDPEEVAAAARNGRVAQVMWAPSALRQGSDAVPEDVDDAVRRSYLQGADVVPIPVEDLPAAFPRGINAILRW